MAHNVLDLDDRIVNQNADNQRKGQEGNDVQGKAKKIHPNERWDGG